MGKQIAKQACVWHTLVFVSTQSPGDARNANPQQQTNRQVRTLYIALERSNSVWKAAFTDEIARRPRLRNVAAGNLQALEHEIQLAKERFGLPPDAPVVSCCEAGRDGFWLHRCLVSMDICNHIVEP